MDNKLYLIENGTATQMNSTLYEKEADLQKLIADNPNLIARAFGERNPRLFLVKQELAIPELDDSGNSFSLDHLLVDETGVPVLVEVKRSTDTRTRREVVAQMIDYACRLSAIDVSSLRISFTGDSDESRELNTDEFWEQVATNLKAERFRLVFAADRIPDSLRVLIEFLDRNMDGIDVYGVELSPYKSDGTLLLSSSIVGNSVIEKKSLSPSIGSWDDNSFSDYLSKMKQKDLADAVRKIKHFAIKKGFIVSYGKGAMFPSFSLRVGERLVCIISSWYKKSAGTIWTADFCIPQLLSFLPPSWSEISLREAISSQHPIENADFVQAWSTPKYQYINIRSLLNTSNMTYFEELLTKFHIDLSRSENQEA